VGGHKGRIEGRGKSGRYLFFKLWVPADEFIIDIAGQVPEAIWRKRGKLLTSLVSLWMKFVTDGEKGD
jgi:hypothetical protein